eukprot:1035140-Pelagomonas_calceolata.AAC.1
MKIDALRTARLKQFMSLTLLPPKGGERGATRGAGSPSTSWCTARVRVLAEALPGGVGCVVRL